MKKYLLLPRMYGDETTKHLPRHKCRDATVAVAKQLASVREKALSVDADISMAMMMIRYESHYHYRGHD